MRENIENINIHIEFPEHYPDEIIETDIKPFIESGIKVNVKKKETEVFASFEWTIPTAIVAYVLKPYFESFLKEAGKQHFQILSNSLKKLAERGKQLKVKLLASSSSPEKLNKSYDQSMAISVMIQTANGKFIKLLFDDDLDKVDWDSAIDQILNYVIEHYENESESKLNEQTLNLEKDRRMMIYSKINKETKKIEFYDDRKLMSEIMNKNNS